MSITVARRRNKFTPRYQTFPITAACTHTHRQPHRSPPIPPPPVSSPWLPLVANSNSETHRSPRVHRYPRVTLFYILFRLLSGIPLSSFHTLGLDLALHVRPCYVFDLACIIAIWLHVIFHLIYLSNWARLSFRLQSIYVSVYLSIDHPSIYLCTDMISTCLTPTAAMNDIYFTKELR